MTTFKVDFELRNTHFKIFTHLEHTPEALHCTFLKEECANRIRLTFHSLSFSLEIRLYGDINLRLLTIDLNIFQKSNW